MIHTLEQTRQRHRDVSAAIASGDGITDLARAWGISKPAVCYWLDRHVTEDVRRAVSANGRTKAQQALRGFDLAARLEMIAMCRAQGWPWHRIARGFNCSTVALWTLVNRHAPDGLAAALEDFNEAA